jgi:hypothetical protein
LAKQKEAQAKAQEPSPYDTWAGTLAQVGKVLGSGLEQAATGIGGMPGAAAEAVNSGISYLPKSMQQPASIAINAVSPVLGAARHARNAGVAPTSGEMDTFLREKGLQHTPINKYEDWAQYLTSAAAQSAIPIGQSATVANAAKGAIASLLPAAAAKGVTELTDSPTAGVLASVLAGAGQHGVKRVFTPAAGVSQQLAKDVGSSQVADLAEYNRLGLPAKVTDVIPESSQSEKAIVSAIQHKPERAAGLVESLQNRSKTAGTRLQDYLSEGAVTTADQHIGTIKTQTESLTKPVYDDLRSSDLTANVSKALKEVFPYVRGTSVKKTPLQSAMTDIKNLLVKKGEGGVEVPNNQAQAAFAAREYIEAKVKSNPELKTQLSPIYKKLNTSLMANYPDLISVDKEKTFADMRLKAVEAGRKAASSGASEDVISQYNAFKTHPKGDVLQQDFKIGYGDTLKKNIQNTPVTGSAATPVNTRGQGAEISAIYDPDTAQKTGFEITANEAKKKYTPPPVEYKTIGERIRHMPGYGYGAVGALGTAAATLGGLATPGVGIPLASISAGVGLTNLIRDSRARNAWIKAAGIENADELKAFLDKGVKRGSFGKSAAKAGIVNAITGYGR